MGKTSGPGYQDDQEEVTDVHSFDVQRSADSSHLLVVDNTGVEHARMAWPLVDPVERAYRLCEAVESAWMSARTDAAAGVDMARLALTQVASAGGLRTAWQVEDAAGRVFLDVGRLPFGINHASALNYVAILQGVYDRSYAACRPRVEQASTGPGVP